MRVLAAGLLTVFALSVWGGIGLFEHREMFSLRPIEHREMLSEHREMGS